MVDPVVALVTLAAGALFCFRGGAALRILLALWGGFVGFALGAALVAQLTGQPLFAGIAGWAGALLGAVVVGSLAYTFYALAVVVWVGSIGFSLGGSLGVALGVSDSWAWLLGIALAIVLVVIALSAGLPENLLNLLAAVVGAAAMVGALMLLLGYVHLADLTPAGVRTAVLSSPWWTGCLVVLAALGTVVQARRPPRAPQTWGPGGHSSPAGP